MDKLRGMVHRSQPTRPFKIVYLGDSLTQGTQDGLTEVDRQAFGYAQLVSKAVGVEPNVAAISKPGIPFNAFADSTFDLQQIDKKRAFMEKVLAPLALFTYYVGAPPLVPAFLWRLAGEGHRTRESRDTKAHPQNNFAVAGFRVRQMRDSRTDRDVLREIHQGLLGTGEVPQQAALTRETLQNGGSFSKGSEVERAIQEKPDVIMLWGGANDSLHGLRGYIDDATLTPLHDQQYTYRVTDPLNGKVSTRTTKEVLPGFESLMVGQDGIVPKLLRGTDAQIFINTIPQVSVTPSMATVGKPLGPLPFRILLSDGTDVSKQIENWVIPTAVKGEGKDGRTNFPPGSQVPLFTALTALVDAFPVRHKEELAQRMEAAQAGLLGEDDVADPDEIATVKERTDAFNDVIKGAEQLSPRVHVIDVNGVLADINENGRALRGEGPDVDVTCTFTGVQRDGKEGMFSFDGLHPSSTGYAVVANEVIDHMRDALAGDPRYAPIENATPVDEKQIFAHDPHRDKPCIILEKAHLAQLRAAVI